VVEQGPAAVHREVVVGVRDPQGATAALDFAFGEAALRGAALVVVHSWNSLPAAIRQQADAERLAAEEDAILAEALAPWREKYPGVPVRQDVVHGHPARVLAAYAGRADLVVIGRNGRSPAIGGRRGQHGRPGHGLTSDGTASGRPISGDGGSRYASG
jgi:nucleotide-binding universal stress UspA family protein